MNYSYRYNLDKMRFQLWVMQRISERHRAHDLLGINVPCCWNMRILLFLFQIEKKSRRKNSFFLKWKKNLKKIIVKRYEHTLIVFMQDFINFWRLDAKIRNFDAFWSILSHGAAVRVFKLLYTQRHIAFMVLIMKPRSPLVLSLKLYHQFKPFAIELTRIFFLSEWV